MARYTRKPRRKTYTKRRFTRSKSRTRKAAPQRTQTIRIVIENPQPQLIPGQLPPGVGNVAAIAPKLARF